MKKIGDGAVRILYSVLFCLVSLGLTWVPSPQITMAQAGLDCAELNGMVIPATIDWLADYRGHGHQRNSNRSGRTGLQPRRILQGTGRNQSSGRHCAENQVPGRPAYSLEQ